MLVALNTPDTPMAIAFRAVEPTWRNYIHYVSLAAQEGDAEMEKFMQIYDHLPRREQISILPEKICELAAVSQGKVMAAVAEQMWAQKRSESIIVASSSHPKVVQATADHALHPFGERDRELFFRLTGGLPDKKGASIVINNNPQTANIHQPAFLGANGFKPMDARVIEMGKFLDAPQEQASFLPGDNHVLEDEYSDED